MSQSDNLDVDNEYRTTTGVDSKYADVASDGHALKDRFGSNEDAKKIEFEAEIIGERVAQWYDDPAAAIREYLSNAETACIRRARAELEDAGEPIPNGVDEMLDAASEQCGYEPTIEVTFNRNTEETRFIIEDNGIGISTDEYLVLKKIGYSTSHMDGERLGQFGMGYMSGFQLTGTEGVFNMRTRSFLSDETYSTANYITNFEYLDGLKEDYGTRFEFPAFCQKAEGIDIREKVAEFADGMRVPVLYREKDTSGQETYNEDYLPTALAEDYDDDSLVIQFENEYFEAVMSPHSPERRGYKTYNVSMPIRRNTETYGSEPKFEATWSWDFRGKQENGPVVACESDESVVGLAPVSDSKYDGLPEEKRDDFIRRSAVPDDAIVMPVPASSRDSYETGHDDFWRYVSECLVDEWGSEVSEQLDALDDFDDFKEASTRNKHIIVRGYRKFGPGYGDNDPSTVVDHFDDELDVTLTEEVAEKLDELQTSHLVVTRGTDNPSYKSHASKTPAWEIIDDATGGGTVYMGKSISPKKAEIAWDLHDDNVIVRLDDEEYDELEELWGWSKLKELPSRNLSEKLPNLSDTLAEKWESTSTSSSSSSSSSSSGGKSRNPRSRRIKVYSKERRTRNAFKEQKAGDVYDKLDNGEPVSTGYYDIDTLLLFDQNETNVSFAKGKTNRSAGLGVAVVPKYVYKFLKDASNVYTSKQAVVEDEAKNATVELSGDREVNITDIPDDELVLVDADVLRSRFSDKHDLLLDYFDEHLDAEAENITFVDSSQFNQYNWAEPRGGTILSFKRRCGISTAQRFRVDGDGNRKGEDHVVEQILLPDEVDWTHDFMKTVRSGVSGSADKKMQVVEYLKEHDCLPTQ
jgi:hypothetical protein